jgi:hypothetical protein
VRSKIDRVTVAVTVAVCREVRRREAPQCRREV